jgi:hypothetical protein
MRNLGLVTILILVVCGLGFNTHANVSAAPNARPQVLKGYVGKYPSELFKGEPGLKRRLRTFLGANYTFFINRLQTEVPIEDDGGALIVRGCMAHSCTIEEAVLVINLSDGKLHCAILSAKYGGKFKVFSEDRAHIPPALNHATSQR